MSAGMASRSREPLVLLQQRHEVGLTVSHDGAGIVGRVSRLGQQNDVARVDETEAGVDDPLFGPDEGDDLLVRVHRHVEALLVPVCDSATELRQALGVGVAVVGGIQDGLVELGQVGRRRGDVRIADAEGDDVSALGTLLGDLAVDLNEEEDREPLQSVGNVHSVSFQGRLV